MVDMLKLSTVAFFNIAQSISVTSNVPIHYYHSPQFWGFAKVFYSAGQSYLDDKSSAGPDYISNLNLLNKN
jgi:hypothetical protein